MENYDVAVLMSTYNGEAYLREQIESIFQQSGVNVTIYVRDDGSKDATNQILKEYAAKTKLKLLDIPGNLGPGVSFMELLHAVSGYAYYAFADQDDVWKPEKLITGIRMLEEQGKGMPALYCSNQILFVDGKETRMRFFSPPPHTLINCICGNYISGCTMLFNHELRNIVAAGRPDISLLKMRLHDTWMITVALVSGIVVYDHDSYIDYRIHSNNTVGLKSGRFKRLMQKLKNEEVRNGRSRLCQELLRLVPFKESGEKKVVKCFADCNKSFKDKMALINNRSIKYECGENRAVFFIKTLLGWQ